MKRKKSTLTLSRTSKKKLHRKSKDEFAGTVDEDNLLIWSPAIARAQEILSNLDPEFPGFWKPVLRYNVAGRFCLVYIVRASEVDGALGPPNQDYQEKPIEADQSGRSQIDKLGSNVPTRIRSDYLIKFEDIKDFEDFKIYVDGWPLDSEIPSHLREMYYELCCSQNSFLHHQLITGLSRKLAVGAISETANIANAIRTSKLTTYLKHLENWDKTLEALEILGMSVAFLRDRLRKLVTLACQSESISESKNKKQHQLNNDFKALKATVLKVKVVMDGLEAQVEDLEAKNEKLSFEFKELACAPW